MKIRLCLTLLFSSLLTACIESPDGATAKILGRWQRLSPAGPGDPNEVSEYIEFRESGVLLSLLRDEGTNEFWLITSATYALTSANQLQVVGTCYKGWERYTCSRTYAIALAGDTLKISGDQEAEYQRIGSLSPNLPPTLAPPMPSPTPNTILATPPPPLPAERFPTPVP